MGLGGRDRVRDDCCVNDEGLGWGWSWGWDWGWLVRLGLGSNGCDVEVGCVEDGSTDCLGDSYSRANEF